ncbi:Dihydrolipoamide acetyltransferase component of pyruvate dehydrogenase complex [Serinicoccus hydrothermalis]|uniref:Dihydrolipoamide acetyltransferase component of pyruvate dehydrogenase complex n=1 Tax=Serinicoccus hydrothermalis TaxID=1758689 RepID=A0A1B1NEI7_9MICO|nr:dihydrolipoamide acetyltransferase family protein [Serinicoccus hydrothermalis]ANS79852.1 Dihydrolipoamide acetyltransferase component of pyruvate dehydrogenase complex [Serinicoccus hydrothermalis]
MPEFKLPDPGEGLVEATIVQWKVAVGDTVKTNDIVVEVETAKSLVELPIPYDGTVTELLAAEGDEVEVGTPIVVVDDGSGAKGTGGARTQSGTDVEDVTDEETAASDDLVPSPPEGGDSTPEDDGSGGSKREAMLVGYGAIEGSTSRRKRRRGASGAEAEAAATPKRKAKASPPVRKYAKDRGVDIDEVTAAGPTGIVRRSDIDAHLDGSAPSTPDVQDVPSSTPADVESGAVSAPGVQSGGGAAYQRPSFDRTGEREERVDVKGVRKMTAQAMVGSAFSAPHVTEFITVDVTRTMELIDRLKADRSFRDLRINPLLVLAKAMTVAVRRNPGVNAVWDEDAQQIVQRHYVNLGIAAATPRGLVVPNIKDADLMDLRQLAEAMTDLVATAKAGRTQPADMSGGTITITNVGVFGVDTGTPIINPGESAIVCFGAVRRMPWVVGTGEQERIEPRWVTQLAVSFDHRLIDGELGSMFLADLAALLEDPARALAWA